MKERPILFSGPMVRAILDGRKTQTRRIINPQPVVEGFTSAEVDEAWGSGFIPVPCPYGKPGDRLWVRETWQPIRSLTVDEQIQQKTILDRFFNREIPAEQIIEAALSLPMGSGDLKALYAADFGEWAYSTDSDLRPWKPSIYMPRWASRITLEVTDVRVQRLLEITEEDAKAEGFPIPEQAGNAGGMSAGRHFEYYWDDLNRKTFPWASNPWVWAVTARAIPLGGKVNDD